MECIHVHMCPITYLLLLALYMHNIVQHRTINANLALETCVCIIV